LCQKQRKHWIEKAYSTKTTISAICHAGLNEQIIPLFVDDKAAGFFNLIFAPTNFSNDILPQIDAYTEKYTIEHSVLRDAIKLIPNTNHRTINSASSLIKSLIDLKVDTASESEVNTQANKNYALDEQRKSTEENKNNLLKALEVSKNMLMYKNCGYTYTAVKEVLGSIFKTIISDVCAGKILIAKDRFDRLLEIAYYENDLKKIRYLLEHLLFQFNNVLLDMFPIYYDLYQISVETISNISIENQPKKFYFFTNEYFNRVVKLINEDPEATNPIISRIINYVNNNYSCDFLISDMLDTFNISISYGCRIFKEKMGITIKTYLNDIRMERTQYFLRYTDWSVKFIAQQVGYSNIRSFYKMYNSYFSIPPEKLRSLYQGI